jgi:hypothetical protein
MTLNKKCKHCGNILTEENASKNGMRNGRKRFRDECKSCRSFHVTKKAKGNIKVKERMREYHKNRGNKEEYFCDICSKKCFKKNNITVCSDPCRLIKYIDKINGCWLWNRSLGKHGYGEVNISGNQMRAHIASYIVFKGEIPKGMLVCHSCDIKNCINPEHLWLGTAKDNSTDMFNKGRRVKKLNQQDVINIRKEWDENYSHSLGSYICAQYGITPSHLNSIVKRKIWKHI